jgi:hypothetical protein
VGGDFYLGKWFVTEFNDPSQQDWCLPPSLEHSRETSNVEELRIPPEDLELFPEEVQAGACQWVNFVAPGLGGFYVTGPPERGGFYTITGILDLTGFYLQTVEIEDC